MSEIGGRARPGGRKCTSSGRVVKQNSKYGNIQGKEFSRVIEKLVGATSSDDEFEGHAIESPGEKEPSAVPDLGPDDVDRCMVCWGACDPASAAADAYNQLSRYVNACDNSPTDLVVGALTMDLNAAAKFELICQECASLVRLLEEREMEVLTLRQELLSRFQANREPPPDPASQEETAEGAADGQEQEQQKAASMLEQEVLDQEAAIQAMVRDREGGMYGIPGLGDTARFEVMSAPPPPSASLDPALDLPLIQEEDTVEAYLNRKDEWITQTPGVENDRGLVEAIVDASSEGVNRRGLAVLQDSYPCCACERVFTSNEALMRHEYFRHGVGDLCGTGSQTLTVGVDPVDEASEKKDVVTTTSLVEVTKADVTLMEDDAGDGDGVGDHDESTDNGEDSRLDDDGNDDDEDLADVSTLNFPMLADLATSVLSKSQQQTVGASPSAKKKGRPRIIDPAGPRSGECQFCGIFIKVDLQGHINRFHTMVRPHECQECGAKLVSRHALAEHKQRLHGSGHSCEHCGAVFARKKQLSVHQWRKHNIGGVQCRLCFKKFARSDTLDNHMRCHERPMQCSLCTARYPFKRELRNHEFLKHGLHGEIPRDSEHRPGEMYRCGKCGRCFGSWAGRDRHKCDSAAALSDLYVCQLCGDWSTRFEGDMVKHMRNLHKIEAETILIADVDEEPLDDEVLEQAMRGVQEAAATPAAAARK